MSKFSFIFVSPDGSLPESDLRKVFFCGSESAGVVLFLVADGRVGTMSAEDCNFVGQTEEFVPDAVQLGLQTASGQVGTSHASCKKCVST